MRRFAVIVLLGLLCTACAAGPSVQPRFAVFEHSDGAPAQTSPAPAPGPPPADVPDNEPAWQQCPAEAASESGGIPSASGGTGDSGGAVRFRCARITGPLDPRAPRSGIGIDLMRATTPTTPADAAPVVLVAGTEQSSRHALAEFAAGPGAALLDAHPVVALDRRGLGPSTDPDCFARGDGAALTAAGTGGSPLARAQSMMRTVDRVTVSCTDVLRPHVDAFDAVHAAGDVERLRAYWGADRIALLTIGAGSDVGLAYAAAAPDHLARLILDSPAPVRTDARTVAERLAQADQAALARFESDCAATDCAVAEDPAGEIGTVLDSARAGLIRGVSPGSVLTVIRRHLAAAAPWEARVTRLGDLLHGAATGDISALEEFADARSNTSGGFVAACSDAPPPATPEQSQTAQQDWSAQYPVFGADAAARMLTCASWPSHADFDLPDHAGIGVLLYSGAADTAVGAGSVDSVTAALSRAGIGNSAVTWGGVGHGALWHSSCAADQLGRYIDAGTLPPNGTACPA